MIVHGLSIARGNDFVSGYFDQVELARPEFHARDLHIHRGPVAHVENDGCSIAIGKNRCRNIWSGRRGFLRRSASKARIDGRKHRNADRNERDHVLPNEFYYRPSHAPFVAQALEIGEAAE